MFNVAHETGDFVPEPFPIKPQVSFWSNVEQKKCGQMTSHPDSLIHSDSFHWGNGANSKQGPLLADSVACAAQGLLFPRTACHLYSLCAGDVYGFITKCLTFTEQLVRS